MLSDSCKDNVLFGQIDFLKVSQFMDGESNC